MKQEPTHLVISGGGIKGIAIVGALDMFFQENPSGYDKIVGFAGSSIGGVLCFLLNLGFKIEELYEIMMHLDFTKYRDLKFFDLFEKLGLDSGEKMMQLIQVITRHSHLENWDMNDKIEHLTFAELWQKTGKELVITGSELKHSRAVYFNYRETPDMRILDALRITISFPFIFQPIRGEDEHKGEIFVDGALFSPYPIEYFIRQGVAKDKIIGIYLHNDNEIADIGNFEEYLRSIFRGVQVWYERFFMRNYEKNTVVISIHEHHSMDFNMDDAKKKLLYEKGKESMRKFLTTIGDKS